MLYSFVISGYYRSVVRCIIVSISSVSISLKSCCFPAASHISRTISHQLRPCDMVQHDVIVSQLSADKVKWVFIKDTLSSEHFFLNFFFLRGISLLHSALEHLRIERQSSNNWMWKYPLNCIWASYKGDF